MSFPKKLRAPKGHGIVISSWVTSVSIRFYQPHLGAVEAIQGCEFSVADRVPCFLPLPQEMSKMEKGGNKIKLRSQAGVMAGVMVVGCERESNSKAKPIWSTEGW